jgi:MFS family permease
MHEHPRVREGENGREFVLASEEERGGSPALTLSQHDVRELQLAKGAIRSGIQLLLAANGHSEDELDRIIIAGAFGTYIDVASAITIGMLPDLPLECFAQVGNAAGIGARLALISNLIPTNIFSAAVEAAGDERLGGLAMGIIQVGQNAGMLVGPLVFGAPAGSAGWPVAFGSLAVMCLLGAAAGWLAHVR